MLLTVRNAIRQASKGRDLGRANSNPVPTRRRVHGTRHGWSHSWAETHDHCQTRLTTCQSILGDT